MRNAGFAIVAMAAVAAMAGAASSPAAAQGAGLESRRAAVAQSADASSQARRRRAPTQLRVYRERRYLPPTAVRTCDAWYEQEYRPSGTVIVPRMRCRWVAG